MNLKLEGTLEFMQSKHLIFSHEETRTRGRFAQNHLAEKGLCIQKCTKISEEKKNQLKVYDDKLQKIKDY